MRDESFGSLDRAVRARLTQLAAFDPARARTSVRLGDAGVPTVQRMRPSAATNNTAAPAVNTAPSSATAATAGAPAPPAGTPAGAQPPAATQQRVPATPAPARVERSDVPATMTGAGAGPSRTPTPAPTPEPAPRQDPGASTSAAAASGAPEAIHAGVAVGARPRPIFPIKKFSDETEITDRVGHCSGYIGSAQAE
jgi:hypothetical protein